MIEWIYLCATLGASIGIARLCASKVEEETGTCLASGCCNHASGYLCPLHSLIAPTGSLREVKRLVSAGHCQEATELLDALLSDIETFEENAWLN